MRNGKKPYSTAFKRWLVEQACKPGASTAGLALHFGVKANQLRRWMRLQHLSEAGPTPVILPVVLSQAAAPSLELAASAPGEVIEIEIGGAAVRVLEGKATTRETVSPDAASAERPSMWPAIRRAGVAGRTTGEPLASARTHSAKSCARASRSTSDGPRRRVASGKRRSAAPPGWTRSSS